MPEPISKTWTSHDGLTLSYQDWAPDGAGQRLPVLCLPGLTRNGRDFEGVAARISAGAGGAPRRVLCPDLRGRGHSQWSPDPALYQPATYAADLGGLLAATGLTRVIAIGTSLGGLLTTMLAQVPGLIAGAVLNDIGPVIEPAGLARIRGYVGVVKEFADWDKAATALAEAWGDVYPQWQAADWAIAARRVMRSGADGLIRFDYDPAIAQPFANDDGTQPQPDLWPLFAGLNTAPLLVVRGALSDILSATTAEALVAGHPDATLLTVPHVGHAPTLDEPEAVAAIDTLLARLD